MNKINKREDRCSIGIDLHKRFAYWHVLNTNNEKIWEGKVPTDKEEVGKQLGVLGIDKQKTDVVFEPIESWGWYSDLLEELGLNVYLANTRKTALIAKNRTKNDKADAKILAELLSKDFLNIITPVPKEIRDLRELVRTREYFVHARTDAKVRVRSALAKLGLICPYTNINCISAIKWIYEQEIREIHKEEINKLFQHIDYLNLQVNDYDKEITKRANGHEKAILLQTIPGIGPIRSLTIISEVGDFARFKNPEKLACFAGLVPSSRSSGGKEKNGHITKQGSSHLRYVLVQAAQNVNESWGELNDFYLSLKEKKGSGVAKVALARKLLVISWYMIRKNEPFKARFAKNHLGGVSKVSVPVA